MQLSIPPKELYDDSMYKSSSYVDVHGNHPPLDLLIYPFEIVFKKEDLKKDCWMFTVKDENIILKMKTMKLFHVFFVIMKDDFLDEINEKNKKQLYLLKEKN